MGMPAELERRWTAREVRDLIAAAPLATPRYEVVDGELLVTPSPGRPHQEAVRLLLIALSLYLDQEPVASVLHSPADVEVESEQVTQPDIFVLPPIEAARLVREDFPAHELLVAIEVVSPSSARFDRVRKRALYQRTIPEYWIVDCDARLIERWRMGEARPEILTELLDWMPEGATRPFHLDLAPFFRRIWAER
jgi:Uma2 family endonuclease